MYLLVSPKGSMTWYLKFRIDGKEKKLRLGNYPETSLQEARDLRQEAKKRVRAGVDPSLFGLSASQDERWEDIAKEYHQKNKIRWSPRHAERVLSTIEEMAPYIGQKKMDDIEALHILAGIRKIEERGAFETAKKSKQVVGQVFQYGIATGRAKRNPAADLRGALAPRPPIAHNPHLSAKDLPAFLRAFGEYRGTTPTRLAFRFLLLTFVRTQEMRFARWEEFDLKAKEWRIPPERMKAKRLHIVPLADQTVALLEELKKATGNRSEGYLFTLPRDRNKPLSENAILTVIAAIGYKGIITGHGFRGTASTILNENGWPADAIERQLAHVEGNKVRAAYNHAEYLPQRKEMMQWWADYVDGAVKS